jgi:chromosome segregation ATPase
LFNAEVKQLTEKLKKYQIEEVANQTQFSKVQQECAELQTKLMSLQSSRNMLEARLKDETSARSQLVSQLFNLRKVHFQHPFTRRLSAYSHVTLVRFTLKD